MEIIVNMACGLANRMFQYSYYLFLKKQGYEVAVDFYLQATKRFVILSQNDLCDFHVY